MFRNTLILLCLIGLIKLKAQNPPEDIPLFPSHIQIDKPSEQQIHHLYKLCKVWGLLKYKHPQITSGKLDWDKELFSYIKLTDHAHFDSLILEKFPPLQESSSGSSISKKLNWIQKDDLFSKDLQSYLRSIAQMKLVEKQAYLEPGKWDITPHFKEKKYPHIDYQDEGVKLLSLFRYWNIIEYFFPYKELMEEDWDKLLLEFIPKILATQNELEYKLSFLELVCTIKDGHGGIHNDAILNKHFGQNQIPIEVKLIQDQAFVAALFMNDSPLKAGDVIVEIGGKPIPDLVKAKRPYIAASTQAGQNRILAEYILRTNQDMIEMKIKRGPKVLNLRLKTDLYNPLRYVQKNIPSHQELSADIAYIYPGSLKQEDIEAVLKTYKNKRSIILDYRSYPFANLQNILPNFLLAYPSYAFKGSRYSRDQLGEFHFTKSYKWGEANESYYKGNFVILVNEYTQSQPEFEILIYSQAPKVSIIGSATAGTLGNWTPIYLPGNMLTSISGNGIYRYDESQVQRIGIIPDIYVERSIEGLKQGKDEVLEKAIEFCEKR
ncbi:MAG: S41 family peptidase [Bacteroidota bacterium]